MVDMKISARVNQLLQAYLRGLTEGGHPPLSREELADVARIIRDQVEAGR